MRVVETHGSGGSPGVMTLPAAPSAASGSTFTTPTHSPAGVSTGALKSGLGAAWTTSVGGGKGAGGVGVMVPGLGVEPGRVTMANMLDFLLTSAHLHRVAAATTDKVKARGRLIRGSGGQEDTAGGRNAPASTTTTNSSPSSSTTTILPTASNTWTRLLKSTAASYQDHTLALLQLALQDGLLDSILPYMVSSLNLGVAPTLTPSPTATTCPRTPAATTKGSTNKGGFLMPGPASHRSPTRDGLSREPALPTTTHAAPAHKEDQRPSSVFRGTPDRSPAIVIHVCDEARGLRQDFTCPRDLLIHHIGYFADVTAGQRLEDVDISVHCDVSIFEWLLRWVKRGQTEDHVPPVLDPRNAVSILISADFLKMAPLVEEVLQYIHDNVNLILEAQVNLNCLSDAILTRLARLFTHWELESLRDRRDRIQSKLYARFLQTLCDVPPAPSRGIYKTAATLYRCCDCGQLLSRAVERQATCTPANTSITTSGHVIYSHTRDGSWSLTEHVRQLKTDLKTWRLVYWRLWGQVHFLPCSTCGAVFPGSEMRLCRTHRVEASSCDLDILLASDAYPCCGARALRFSPLPVRNAVLWAGVPLLPSYKGERSLLDRSWLAHYLHHGERDVHTTGRTGAGESSTTASTGEASVSASSDSSSDEEEGGGRRRPGLSSRLRANLLRRAARAKRTLTCEVMAEPSLRWDAGRSTRHNQDAQREREGRVLRDLTSWLTIAAPTAHDAAHGSHKGHRGRPDRRKECSGGPDPGSYYRLEAEFRERHGSHSHGHSTGSTGSFRAKVQAISRIKMRLRHRAAFSASR
ncbi:uncharacterized protein [Panulirus ornatus]|uniref:uncharacterized protein isoform X2 n=1 Tax=Panulirus ornatus TaxID=150431 RepID=UPI003A8405E0